MPEMCVAPVCAAVAVRVFADAVPWAEMAAMLPAIRRAAAEIETLWEEILAMPHPS
jgi:hypothetical protein